VLALLHDFGKRAGLIEYLKPRRTGNLEMKTDCTFFCRIWIGIPLFSGEINACSCYKELERSHSEERTCQNGERGKRLNLVAF